MNECGAVIGELYACKSAYNYGLFLVTKIFRNFYTERGNF